MKNDNLNFNISDQYVQASHDFGKTSYYNVNTQTTTVVPWGTLDWVNHLFGNVLSVTIWFAIIYFTGHYFKAW